MLQDRFKVVHKETGQVSEVYDITYCNSNHATKPYFLVYLNSTFIELPAEDFVPLSQV